MNKAIASSGSFQNYINSNTSLFQSNNNNNNNVNNNDTNNSFTNLTIINSLTSLNLCSLKYAEITDNLTYKYSIIGTSQNGAIIKYINSILYIISNYKYLVGNTIFNNYNNNINTTTINTTHLSIFDPLVIIGNNNTNTLDRGVIFSYKDPNNNTHYSLLHFNYNNNANSPNNHFFALYDQPKDSNNVEITSSINNLNNFNNFNNLSTLYINKLNVSNIESVFANSNVFFNNQVTFRNNFNNTNFITIQNNLSYNCGITFGLTPYNATILFNPAFNNTIFIYDNLNVNGTLGVTGIASFYNNLNVNGTLGVTGITTFYNNVIINGDITMEKLVIYPSIIYGITGMIDIANIESVIANKYLTILTLNIDTQDEFTINLPSVGINGQLIKICITNNSSSYVGGKLSIAYNGGSDIVVADYSILFIKKSSEFICDGTTWYSIN